MPYKPEEHELFWTSMDEADLIGDLAIIPEKIRILMKWVLENPYRFPELSEGLRVCKSRPEERDGVVYAIRLAFNVTEFDEPDESGFTGVITFVHVSRLENEQLLADEQPSNGGN